MSKLNSQKQVKDVEEVPEIEEPKKKVKKIVEVPEVEEEEEESDIEEEDEDDEDENGEVPVPVKAEPKADPDKLTQQRAEEIQILQNNGIYRVEMLYQIGQLNQNIVDLNTLIAGVIENAKK